VSYCLGSTRDPNTCVAFVFNAEATVVSARGNGQAGAEPAEQDLGAGNDERLGALVSKARDAAEADSVVKALLDMRKFILEHMPHMQTVVAKSEGMQVVVDCLFGRGFLTMEDQIKVAEAASRVLCTM